ncbi:MAG: cytochrome c [Bacteroidia bacterium]|nr:cytochrome c [Bacteroidia bacterium]
MIKKQVIVLSCIFLSCSTYKLLEPTQEDVEKNKSKFSNITLEDLQQGKKIYESNCNLCHKLYKPNALTEEQWKKIIPPMVKKVNKKAGQAILSAKEEELILKYILVIKERK